MTKSGLSALLRPEDSIVVLIDHQPFQFANLHSHEPTLIIVRASLRMARELDALNQERRDIEAGMQQEALAAAGAPEGLASPSGCMPSGR